MKIKKVKEYIESTKKQFIYLKNGGYDDSFCGHDYILRIKDKKKFHLGSSKYPCIKILKTANLNSHISMVCWISQAYEDCIHVDINYVTTLAYQGAHNQAIQDTVLCHSPSKKIEINNFENQVKEFEEESLRYIKDNREWIVVWKGNNQEADKEAMIKLQNKKMKKEKITLGTSDYSKKQMESGDIGWSIGDSSKAFLNRIEMYEQAGYVVKFETSILRKIFGFGIYKITATK